MALREREAISHYRIVRRLGAGGMGEVYLAEDMELRRKVALKLLKPESLSDERLRKRLLREAQTAATLDHPNICAIYEVGSDHDRSFIAMQYVEGETLAHLIRSRPLRLIESLDLAVQIADALSEAHSRNIIHRDIKPQNIMITGRGQAKLLDFGLAGLIGQKLSNPSEAETATLLTGSALVVGTVPYMSPEQLKGETLDGRSDIFSFGTVLYEMATGRQPFAARSDAQTVTDILTRDPPPLARYAADAPGELQRIITKVLAKNRDKRYQTAADLLIDLRSLKERLEREAESVRTLSLETPADVEVGSEQRSTVTAGLVARSTRPRDRLLSVFRRRWLATASIGALLLVVVVALIRPRESSAEIDSVAILPYSGTGDNPSLDYLSDGIAEGLIINLSQLPRLRVMSRTSAFHYRPPEMDPSEIGRRLNVKAVAIVRVRQIDDRLVISLELVNTSDSRQIWGAQYERRVGDLLAVQAELSQSISERLRLRLSGDEQKQITRRSTDDPEAYQLYLEGRFQYNKLTEEAIRRSIDLFKRAIAKDDQFALASAALSLSYTTLGLNFVQPRLAIEDGRTWALKALDLDNALAEAHFSLGLIKYGYDWEWAAAENEFKHVLDLNPNYASAYQPYGYLLETMNRVPEAIKMMQRAVALDPFSVIANHNLADAYYYAGQYDQAIAAYRKALDLDSGFYFAHLNIAHTFALRGMREEALAELSSTPEMPTEKALVRAAIAQVYALTGKAAEAQKILNSLIASLPGEYVRPYEVAAICAALGRKDQALEWLDKSLQERSIYILTIEVDPQFNFLRDDKRFKDLLRRIGLPR